MSIRSVIAKSVAASAAMVVIAASPALANQVNRGSHSCAPDQHVVLSFNLSSNSSSYIIYTYYDSDGNVAGMRLDWGSGSSHEVEVPRRSVISWLVKSPVTVTYAGAGCR